VARGFIGVASATHATPVEPPLNPAESAGMGTIIVARIPRGWNLCLWEIRGVCLENV